MRDLENVLARSRGRLMSITESEFVAANARAWHTNESGPVALAARYDASLDRLLVELASGQVVTLSHRDLPGLEQASSDDLACIEVSPSGLGLHFPAVDGDVYLPALKDFFEPGAD